ncbi:MAG: hypothetical protein U0236_04535 [Nitrospira sp.]
MKAFWFQGLLISAAIVAVGCVGPQSIVRFEERLLAAGYPLEYVESYKTGYESFCAEKFADKSHPLTSWEFEYCLSRNMEVMAGQHPKSSKSYQQGREDGKIAGESSFRFYTQYMQEARQIQEMSRMIKPLSYQELKMLNQPFDKFNK